MLNINAKRKRKVLRNIAASLLAAVFLTASVLVWSFQIEPGLIRTVNYNVIIDNLPENWQGRQIAFFSDIHAGPGFGSKRLAKAIDKIMENTPDLIVFGGDLVDSSTPLDDHVFSDNIKQQLSRLEAPFGKFAVIGNHDNRLKKELDAATEWLTESGFSLLINQSVMIDDLWLGGLDESYFGVPDLENTLNLPQAGSHGELEQQAWIMLMHQPDYLPETDRPDLFSHLDLILSGHSHNGQITLFGKPLLTVHQGEKYTRGLYSLPDTDDTKLLVTSGLGTVLIHARLFNPPEIVIITLQS